ncbi:PREDICTED: uncharacterized protein LOC108977301 [Bactrocera latifrons]|uniref:uncharacterized protein LOC108977301 n=1 Tax=Bactrocera latifrons TaxID=174628 RepID=UPI0008DDA9D1|nr:PREDICTED: uncharacterized protein LOC108977301 [Bactrocera latifrons]
MSALTAFATISTEMADHAEAALNRRILRDHSNPFDVTELAFVSNYRVNKDAFLMLLNVVDNDIKHTPIPVQLHLAVLKGCPLQDHIAAMPDLSAIHFPDDGDVNVLFYECLA